MGTPRFLTDNILALQPQAPLRTTCDIGNLQAQVCAGSMVLLRSHITKFSAQGDLNGLTLLVQEFLDAALARVDAALAAAYPE